MSTPAPGQSSSGQPGAGQAGGGHAAPGHAAPGHAAPGRPAAAQSAAATAATAASAASAAGRHAAPADADGETESLRVQLAERVADLQRVTAEYANYRKRVDRDRAAVAEGATGVVLAGLLPVLDDVDRARQHGDLSGAFKAVADQLAAILEKLGLQQFGTAGDPFDPMMHEAVAHQTSPDVTEPTCVAVFRQGYRHGSRLLRAALVAVADPESASTTASAPGPASPASAGSSGGPSGGPASDGSAAGGSGASGSGSGDGGNHPPGTS